MLAVSAMASLTIRDREEPLAQLLRLRAAEHGVSPEEEAHAILRDAVLDAGKRGHPAPPADAEGEWHLTASFEDLLAFGAKPPLDFNQKARTDELYSYLDRE